MAKMRLAVHTRDGFACLICGFAPPVPDGYTGRYALAEYDPGRARLLELDHIIPHALGGEFKLDNLQTLCNSCNARKGTKIA